MGDGVTGAEEVGNSGRRQVGLQQLLICFPCTYTPYSLFSFPIVGIAGVGIAVCTGEGWAQPGGSRGGTRAKGVGDHGRADRGRDRRLMGRGVGGGCVQRG